MKWEKYIWFQRLLMLSLPMWRVQEFLLKKKKKSVNLSRRPKRFCYRIYPKLHQENNTSVQFLRRVSEQEIQRNSHNSYSCHLIFAGFPPRFYRMLFFPVFLHQQNIFLLRESCFLAGLWGFYIWKTIVSFSEVCELFPWHT